MSAVWWALIILFMPVWLWVIVRVVCMAYFRSVEQSKKENWDE